MSKIKVLIIEDSGLMRLILSDILNEDSQIDLLDTANDGKEGVDKTLALSPDVVVTDLVMPKYDGIYAIKQIMEKNPTPIVLLSSLENNNPIVFDALEAGAIEFIDKPKQKVVSGLRDVNKKLINAVKSASRVNLSTVVNKISRRNNNAHSFASQLQYEIVAIGSSTGGPGAIETILKGIPSNFPIPVVIVQHMPDRFLDSFAQRLNNHTPLNVKIASKGEILKEGYIYIAPGTSNLFIKQDYPGGPSRFEMTLKKYKEFNFPSADCLFESVAKVYGNKAIAAILTGMGKDGVNGIGTIKTNGGLTIAQDEKSSIVFGMPKSAIESGNVQRIVTLKDIPGFIVSSISA